MNKPKGIPVLLQSYSVYVYVSWSGVRPLTSFYDAVKRMNARSSDPISPVQHIGLGMYLCADYATARLLANKADEVGAEFAVIIQGEAEQFTLQDGDILANQLFKKRVRRKEQSNV